MPSPVPACEVTQQTLDVSGEPDRGIEGEKVACVIDSYRDKGGNGWRQWSDGWIEQGGKANATRSATGPFVSWTGFTLMPVTR